MTHAPGQPSDRALDALLAGYASGSLSPPLHVLVAGHLALSPQSRAFVRHLEAANAAALEETAPEPISNREAKLEAIFASADREPIGPDQGRGEPSPDDVLPGALVHFLGTSLHGIRWRTLLPGIREYKAESAAQGEALLYWVRRGRSMPAHTHGGTEYTLVLRGGFTDVTGHYRRGDIAVADADLVHRPRADRDEDCICYTVSEAPLRLTGPFGRLLQRLRDGRLLR